MIGEDMKDTDREREKQKSRLRQGMTTSSEKRAKPEKSEIEKLDAKLRRHRAVRTYAAWQ